MLTVLKTALEVGLIYGLVALALFISFSILNIADLSTDGCFTLGCAVGAMLTIAGHPLLALPAAMAAGVLSGFITAFLQTRLGVESILAGIISNTGLYTINLAVMGFSSNVSITGRATVFSLFKALAGGSQWSTLVLLALLLGVILLVNYCSFAVYYDDETFLYKDLRHRKKIYHYSQITGQQSLMTRSGINTMLFVGGDTVELNSGMQGVSDFLSKAFHRWCEQKGVDPDSVENNPAMLTYFPQPEE